MYSSDAEFWHPLFIVKGRDNMFGAHMFWSFINRKTNARVKRIGRLLCCLPKITSNASQDNTGAIVEEAQQHVMLFRTTLVNPGAGPSAKEVSNKQ